MPLSVRIGAGALCALALWAPPAAGQQTTEDGIRALARGDYEAAARVLRPLAEDEAKPDPVAQFFLATLYESGKGVPLDMGRACRLFLRSGTRAHAFSEQSAAIAAHLREQLGGPASPLCVADERWRGGPPQSFALATTIGNVGAQPATADGVIALARGDYQRAVEILKPIAEDWRSQDSTAQFLMAGLYEAGRGVPVDPLRACALYMRASSHLEHPIGRQASALFSALAGRGHEFNDECQLLARVGFEHGFEPASFHLTAGHFVEWRLADAAVTYGGKTRRHEMPYAEPGARFLPLRHTELATGAARDARRHFVEMFMWVPAAHSASWQLRWHIFEVVRDDVIRVAGAESLATVEGDPPSRATFDVRDYGVLRVDDEGFAEWEVLKGEHPQSERIESEAERREVREAQQARDAALKNTDWSHKADVSRQPALTYSDSDGCGQVRVYGSTRDRTEAIVVRATLPDTLPSAQSFTYDLSRDLVNIAVETYVYATPQREFEFCAHLVIREEGSQAPETWRAVAGTVTIELSAPGVRARAPHSRRATVTLSNVVLRNSVGTTVKAPRAIRLTAIVGSLNGG